jgi:hypothetical protein
MTFPKIHVQKVTATTIGEVRAESKRVSDPHQFYSPPIRNLIPAVKFADSAGYPTTSL